MPLFLCPLRRRGAHYWRTFGAAFGGMFVANPFSKPLKVPRNSLFRGPAERNFRENSGLNLEVFFAVPTPN